jgi:hypothetical protein
VLDDQALMMAERQVEKLREQRDRELLDQALALLDKLNDLVKERERYDVEVVALVKKLRDTGVAWSAIGDVLGVTHQAARQRYAKHVAS